MKGKQILIAAGLILLIILLLAGLLVPYSTKVGITPLSEVPSDYRNAVSIPPDTHCDTVYMVENRYVLRKTQTFYVIPVALADLDDVGTAGISYWQFRLYVSSPTRHPAKLKDLRLDVEADHNTALMNVAGPSGFSSKQSVPQNEMTHWDDSVYLATFHVATGYSGGLANKECQAQFCWSGTISLGPFMPDLAFKINGSQNYIGNVKSS